VWSRDTLVGGIYGLAIGNIFFGESMFSRTSNGSKTAMLALCRLLEERGFALLDCQVESPHLVTLGAERMLRTDFRSCLEEHCGKRSRLDRLPRDALPAADLLEECVAALQ
jgi:leucyl/phenylalanyl-tRNA--protein transferase